MITIQIKNDDDLSLVLTSLRVAAATYAENTKIAKAAGYSGLADQFKRQEADALRIAGEIEEQL